MWGKEASKRVKLNLTVSFIFSAINEVETRILEYVVSQCSELESLGLRIIACACVSKNDSPIPRCDYWKKVIFPAVKGDHTRSHKRQLRSLRDLESFNQKIIRNKPLKLDKKLSFWKFNAFEHVCILIIASFCIEKCMHLMHLK